MQKSPAIANIFLSIPPTQKSQISEKQKNR